MAAFWGRKGTCLGMGSLFNFNSWTVTTERDLLELATLDTALTVLWVSQLSGNVRWSGSFEGFLDTATIPDVDTQTTGFFDSSITTATFTDGAGNTLVGTIFIESIEQVNDGTDAGRYTANFRGSGALTAATG